MLALTFNPPFVVVEEIRFKMVSKLVSGLPLQFMLMKLKSRCSILFHLLVPGGKWETEMGISISLQKS